MTTLEQQELPSGWKWVKLGDVSTMRQIGLVRSISEQGDDRRIPYLKMNNITSDGKIDVSDSTKVDTSEEEFQKYLLSEGDFLFNTRNSRELVGKTAIFNVQGGGWVFNNNIMRLRFSENLYPTFLGLCFQSSIIKNQLEQYKANTTNICAIYDRQVREINIPLPPLGEQKRIAGILNEQMAAVEEAKKAAEERLEAVKALPSAYLREVFPSSEDELPSGWQWVKLGDVVLRNGLVRGPFGGSLKKEIFVSSGYMVYEQSHVISGNLLEGRYFVTEAKYKEMERFQIQPSDLLMSCSGTIGKVAVVPKEAPQGIINQALLKIRIDPAICKTEYVKYFLQSESFYQGITETAVGTAMVNVASVRTLNFIPIPLPPLEEQKRIAKELDDKIAGVKLAEASIQQELDTIEAMPAALLRKAFNGEL